MHSFIIELYWQNPPDLRRDAPVGLGIAILYVTDAGLIHAGQFGLGADRQRAGQPRGMNLLADMFPGGARINSGDSQTSQTAALDVAVSNGVQTGGNEVGTSNQETVAVSKRGVQIGRDEPFCEKVDPGGSRDLSMR
jgi:hypothetical protein